MKLDTPKEILREIILRSPKASEREIFNTFSVAASKNMDIMNQLIKYWFANNYKTMLFQEIAPHQYTVRDVRPTRTTAERTVRDRAIVKSVLMDFVLSNGKMLRNATFGDCAKEGGWLLAIANLGKTHEVVGRKLTEADLINLRMRNASKAKAA